jgi:small-conductance mechanosensitive channel
MVLFAAAAACAGAARPAHALQDSLPRPSADSLAPPAPVLAVAPVPVAPIDTATLALHNRLIMVFRAPLGATTPAERASGAARRIEALIESGARDSVTTRPIREGTLVAVAGRPVFTVTAGDADTLIGETPALVAAAAAERLREALRAEVEQRSLARLAQSIALAIVATLLFLFALRLLRRVRAFVLRLIPVAAAARAPTLAVRGFTLLSADQLLGFLRRSVDALAWALGLFSAYLWLAYCLTRFPYSRPWGEALGTYLISTVKDLALIAVSGVPGIFTVVIIVLVTRFVTRLVRGFFVAVEGGEVKLDWVHPETANPTRRIITAMLWLFALVVSYPYVPGSGSDVFKGVSVFVGLVISLGSSGLMSQAMSGLVIMYSRALKPGDYVRIGDVEGTVSALGMLSTKVQSTKNEEITLPNAVIVATTTKNYSRLAGTHGLSLSTTVTIGYDTPWRQVQAMLVMAAKRTAGLRHDPPPRVLQTALSDWYIEYELRAVIDEPPQRGPILSALHGHIVDVFNEYGVQIMSPNYEGDPPHPLVVPRDRWYAAPASRPSEDGDGSGSGATAPDGPA